MTHSKPNGPRRGLLALNALLLAALGAITLAPTAGAQSTTPRARGEYSLVGGTVTGANANAVYVLDSANREIIALLWDDSRKQINGIGYRDLANDLFIEPRR